MPPAPARPWAQKPAATQKPRTSLGPRMNSLSGVNASGPLTRRTTSASFKDGVRTIALLINGSNRSQSGSSRRPLKSAGMPSRPHGSVGRHRREHALRLGGADELERQAERLRPRRLTRELLHALGARGQPQRADLVPAGLEADLVLQHPVEVDRVHHHPGQAERAAELADQPGGVKRRPARDASALDEDEVVPAEAREPVEDRRAADTTTDDDGACVLFQTVSRRGPPPSRVSTPARGAARPPSRRRRR